MKLVLGFLQYCVRQIAAQFCRACDCIIPKDKRIVLVTQPDGDDQGASICLELKRLGWDGQIDWLVHCDPGPFREWQLRRGLGGIPIRFFYLYSLRGIWSYFRARCVFYTHGALFNYSPPKRKIVVNLWHGMPIKRIWRGVPRSQLPLSTFLISTSPFFSDVLMKASGFGPDRLLSTGLPRNDFLTRARPTAAAMAASLRGNAQRLIFFLPTYRVSVRGFKTADGTETNSILGLSDADAERLHGWLKARHCKLIVKPHPMSINAGKPFINDDYWTMVDDQSLFEQGLGLYELLAYADLLVTDVSSVYVDFLVTGKPQILFFPDIEKYENTRGFLLQPFADYAPGPIARSYSDLESSLDLWISGDDSWSARRQQLRELMVPASTRSAAEALLAELQI